MSTNTNVPVGQAKQIMDELKDQANQLLSSTKNVSLESFQVGALGNFPYYWQDSSNLKYNKKTYDWVKSALAKRNSGDPVSLDGVYTNEYLKAISSISYSLSTSDQASLNAAHANAQNQQGALLNAWVSAFGSLPTGNTPVNEILSTILTDWTSTPNTTLMHIQNARNLNQLLDKTPPAGKPILPVLAAYLNALGSAISLENAVSFNGGILTDLTNAINNPSKDNGAILLNDGSTNYHPNYPIATQVSDIINGLHDTKNAIPLSMSVSKYSGSEVKVSVSGKVGFTIPILSFFTLGFGAKSSYFKDTIVQKSSNIKIQMEFTGVTLAEFGPQNYDMSSREGWNYLDPIRNAVKNGSSDVSGFKFSPNPQIDFTKDGPFAFLDAVAFSNYPTIIITAESNDYKSIYTDLNAAASFSINFLGIPFGGGASGSYSKKTLNVDQSAGSVSITLSPPPQLVGGTQTSSEGFVLGVQPSYPAA